MISSYTSSESIYVFQILLSVHNVENVLPCSTMHHTMQADSHYLYKSDLPRNYNLYAQLLVNKNVASLSNIIS